MQQRADFVYYHQLWCEDADGRVLSLDGPLSTASDLPLDTDAFSSLVSRAFPDKKGVRCFEIYGLFVASLSATTLKKYSELLVESLKTNFPAFFLLTK
jgi:hypothetical protein